MKTAEKYQTKKELRKAKRNNARLYPMYKMFSWDLLFFYSTQYLFYTITKGISAADVLKISAFYPLFIILLQVPAIICSDWLGRKKSIVLGNAILSIYILAIIYIPGAMGIMIGNFICAFGSSLKTLQESNLLYDSVSTKGGDGLFSKINEKGGSGYYILDGIASLMAGYLFVINQYLPMFICLAFTVLSTVLALKFQDVYENEIQGNTIKKRVEEYKKDLRESMKAIAKSKRLRSIILFGVIFLSLVTIVDTYRESLLIDIGIKEETFSIIFASLTLLGGLSLKLQNKLHKKFRNRTYTVLALGYVASVIMIGIVTSKYQVIAIMPIILLMYAVQFIGHSNYYIISDRYLHNFTNAKNRSRVDFSYEWITNLSISVTSFFAGMLLEKVSTANAFLLVGLLFLIAFILCLDYMRKRVGLKPEEYEKQDIEV